MADEDALFETWWALHRLRNWHWKRNNSDRGPEPTPEYMMGFKDHCRDGWMARASLHLTRAA